MKIKYWLSHKLGLWYWGIIFILGLGLIFLGLSYYLFYNEQIKIFVWIDGISGQGITCIIIGLALCLGVLVKLKRILLNPLIEHLSPGEHAAKFLIEMKKRSGGPKFVVLGGGSGLANLLRGLKKYSSNITAIVSMTDDGRSSGRLRRDLGVLPPGDIRNCLTALSPSEKLLTKLFDFRFRKGRGLSGHSFGNLFLAAMQEVSGGFDQAILESSKILEVAGKVIPSTLDNIRLIAEFKDGRQIVGESTIPKIGHQSPIKKIYLSSPKTSANPKAIRAIFKADFIIIGPGSLFTSIIPNLLIAEISEKLSQSKVPKLYVCNVSTERGETEGFDIEDHVRQIIKYSRKDVLSHILVNKKVIRRDQSFLLGKIYNVTSKKKEILGLSTFRYNVISEKNPLYHDSNKLAQTVMRIYNRYSNS